MMPRPTPSSVAGQVAPEEAEAKDQAAQRRLADRVDPGGVIQLAEFDGDGESHRQQGDRSGRGSGQQEPDAEERRQRPERVPGVGGDEAWQGVGIAAGADAQGGQPGRSGSSGLMDYVGVAP